jgi:glycosyltransferase involved in cell wall biosynthesis
MSATASVLTTVYNGARFVERYAGVVDAARDLDLAWLLVDDGSSDGTIEAVRARLDSLGLAGRVRILEPGRLKRPGALNHGMAAVETPIVFLHDFDDESWPERFASQRAALEADPTLAVVGGGYIHVWADEGREETRSLAFDAARYRRAFPLWVPFPHTFMAFRTEAVRAVGGYPDWDDYEEMGLIARLLAAGWEIGAVDLLMGRHFIYRSSYFESQRSYLARRWRARRRQLSMRREFAFIRPGWFQMTARFGYAFLPEAMKRWVRRRVGHAG